MSTKYLAHFLIGLFASLLSFERSLHLLELSLLSDMWFGIISSQSVACLFISRSAGFLIRFTAAVGVLNSATLFLTHHAPAVLALFQFFLLWDSCCPLCLEYSFSLCCSAAQSCLTPRNPMDYSTPGFLSYTVSGSLLKFMSIELMILSTISSLAAPFFCLQYFPASGSFPMKY